jgi:hypothetical protein
MPYTRLWLSAFAQRSQGWALLLFYSAHSLVNIGAFSPGFVFPNLLPYLLPLLQLSLVAEIPSNAVVSGAPNFPQCFIILVLVRGGTPV